MKNPTEINSKNTVFIIGIVHGLLHERKEEFKSVKLKLEEAGLKSVCFFDLFTILEDTQEMPTIDEIMKMCAPYLVMCDTVITLPKWETSVHSTMEFRIAQILQKQIYPADKYLLDLEKNKSKEHA